MPVKHLEHRTVWSWLAAALVAACLMIPAAASAQVVVIANGSPITELDIHQRGKLMATSSHKTPSRQEIINELIDDRLKIAKAKTYDVDLSQSEIDASFNDMARRQRITPEQFTQALERAGMSANAVKARIRAEMTWVQLVRGKFGASLQVADGDIANAMRSRNEPENTVAYIYTLYPITIVVPNGSSAAVVDAKRREAENLRGRFTSCKSGLAMARALRDVAVREPITKSSADLAPQLRDLLAQLEVGRLSTPDATPQGLQMFALCNKKESAAESPAKNEMREQIFTKRYATEAKKFLEEIRKSAMIEYK